MGVLHDGLVRRRGRRRRHVDLLVVHGAFDVYGVRRRRIDRRHVDGSGKREPPEELIEHGEGGEPERDVRGSPSTSIRGRRRQTDHENQREGERDNPPHALTFTLASAPVKRVLLSCAKSWSATRDSTGWLSQTPTQDDREGRRSVPASAAPGAVLAGPDCGPPHSAASLALLLQPSFNARDPLLDDLICA